MIQIKHKLTETILIELATLTGAHLRYVNLTGANLRGANLTGQDHIIARTRILPEGDIIGYKKLAGGLIATLLIPKAARRSHAMGRKCRAEYAKVIKIEDYRNKTGDAVKSGGSSRNFNYIYTVGETVYPDSFDPDWTRECANGIHFFITRIEAERY